MLKIVKILSTEVKYIYHRTSIDNRALNERNREYRFIKVYNKWIRK